MTIKLKTIIAKFETLSEEEIAKNAVEKELSCLEKAYFRSMYKGLPKSDVEILDSACQELRNRATNVRSQYNNTLARTLAQCFALYFSEIAATSCAYKESADEALNVLKEFAANGGPAVGKYQSFEDSYLENSQIDDFMTELSISTPLDLNIKPKLNDDTTSGEWKIQPRLSSSTSNMREEINRNNSNSICTLDIE